MPKIEIIMNDILKHTPPIDVLFLDLTEEDLTKFFIFYQIDLNTNKNCVIIEYCTSRRLM